ncbi:hypothetical protein [Maribacter sp. IgM3_T14_3]|uniref:hypothetical protein n=1 Tax=Maribacter sp. IgM3_T14_3 TaxID=3415140 RepID=UPI003C6F42A2
MLSIIKKIGLGPIVLLTLYLIDPFNFGFAFGYLIFIYFFLSGKAILPLLDKDIVFITLFTAVYAVYYSFNPISGSQFIFIYLLFPPTFYLLGKLISNKINNFENIYKILLLIATIYSLIALISVLLNIYNVGFYQVNRDVSMIWSHDPMNATGMAAYLFANMCLPGIILFSFKKNKHSENLILILIYALSLIAVLRLGSRTQLGITLITLFVSIFYFLAKQSIVKKAISLIMLTVFTILSISYISINSKSDIFSAYADRMDSKKYGAGTAGGRTERWTKSIENLIDKPLGWDVTEFGYSHNLWLDAARVGTVICFILLVWFSIRSTINVYKVTKNKILPLRLKNLTLIYFIAFYLQFFVEPILDGSIQLFVFYCLFQGIINESLTLSEEKK